MYIDAIDLLITLNVLQIHVLVYRLSNGGPDRRCVIETISPDKPNVALY